MPTYDYRCNSCGHAFELFQSMTAPVKRKCPECSKNALERLIGTGAAVLFKGSGFYETDYRSEGYRKAAESEQKSAQKPEKGPVESGGGSSGKTSGDKPAGGSGTKPAGAGASKSDAKTGAGTPAKSRPSA